MVRKVLAREIRNGIDEQGRSGGDLGGRAWAERDLERRPVGLDGSEVWIAAAGLLQPELGILEALVSLPHAAVRQVSVDLGRVVAGLDRTLKQVDGRRPQVLAGKAVGLAGQDAPVGGEAAGGVVVRDRLPQVVVALLAEGLELCL